MRSKRHSSQNLFTIALFGMATFMLASCSSYRNTADNDGIYSNGTAEVATSEEVETDTESKNNYYEQYFKTKNQSLQNIPEEDLIFTDIESYTTTEVTDDNGNIIILEDNGYEEGFAGWGDNGGNVTVNVYGGGGFYGNFGGWNNPWAFNGFYGPRWGLGWGWGNAYWGWGNGFWGNGFWGNGFWGWGYGGFYNPWYCAYNGGFFGINNPYYGGGFGYAANYNRGRRNTGFAAGRSNYSRNRSSIGNRSNRSSLNNRGTGYARSEIGRRSTSRSRAYSRNSSVRNRNSVRNSRPNSSVNRNSRSSVRNSRPSSSVNRSSRPRSSMNRSSRPSSSMNRSSRPSSSMNRGGSRGGGSRSSGGRRGGGRGRG